jgi:hypothetical protein
MTEEEFAMKKPLLFLLAVGCLAQSGCAFLGGAAVGAAGAGAAYEVNNKRQMDRLDEDYRSGRINREEYEDRKQQIQKGSIIY